MADGELVNEAQLKAKLGLSPEHLALLREVRPAMRRKARSVARSQGTGDPDDLCQLGMEEAGRLAPKFQPDRGLTFYQFVIKAARGAMIDACIRDLRERAMAHHMQRAAEHVLEHVDTGDYLTESEDIRKQRFDHARLAVGAATAMSLLQKPATPEEALMSAQETEQLRIVIERALEGLDLVDRILVVEHNIQGRAMVDIAREVGVEYDQARYRMKKALEKVGERVKRGLG